MSSKKEKNKKDESREKEPQDSSSISKEKKEEKKEPKQIAQFKKFGGTRGQKLDRDASQSRDSNFERDGTGNLVKKKETEDQAVRRLKDEIYALDAQMLKLE